MAAKAAKSENLLLRWWQAAVVFLGEVKAELLKVAWPSRNETISSTWVVIGAVVVVALWIFVIDKLTAMMMAGLVRLFG